MDPITWSDAKVETVSEGNAVQKKPRDQGLKNYEGLYHAFGEAGEHHLEAKCQSLLCPHRQALVKLQQVGEEGWLTDKIFL